MLHVYVGRLLIRVCQVHWHSLVHRTAEHGAWPFFLPFGLAIWAVVQQPTVCLLY
jgi:hypothetical protein